MENMAITDSRRGRLGMAATILLTLGLAACGGGAETPQSLTLARSQLNSAQTGGSLAALPDAQVHLAAARDRLAMAERALADDEAERADLYAREALAEVSVARAKARANEAQSAAADIERAIEALRSETQARVPVGQPGSGTQLRPAPVPSTR